MSEPDERKIIVDEDWKSQVEREKAELQQKRASDNDASAPSAAGPASAAAPVKTPDTASGGPAEPHVLPPASLEVLFNTLAAQALSAMGRLADASGQASKPHRPLAKHFIDTLALLEEKTKGNLTPHEAAMLRQILHELRLTFISVKAE